MIMLRNVPRRGRGGKGWLLFLASLAAASCAAPASGGNSPPPAPIAAEPEAKGELPVIVKAAEAANICFIQPTEELRASLTPEAYAVLVESATEPPFQNAFWDNHRAGVYVDAVDGTPLFSSREKFDSGSGWPSFWSPLDPARLLLVEDLAYGMRRIEVRARKSGGHLGHLFDDGPAPSGLRYCMNSASLRFIPAEELAAAGLAELLPLFAEQPAKR